jgi:hypothetical protein
MGICHKRQQIGDYRRHLRCDSPHGGLKIHEVCILRMEILDFSEADRRQMEKFPGQSLGFAQLLAISDGGFGF